MEIQLDFAVPKVPDRVLLCNISDAIRYQCSTYRIEVPLELQQFVQVNDSEAGRKWEQALMREAGRMPLELLREWVAALYSGMCRAEMRGLLKEREARGAESAQESSPG